MAEEGRLGRRIASHRQRRGLSQTEFGRLVGRSEAWVSQVERGVRSVTRFDVLERIAAALDIPLADLAPVEAVVERPPAARPLRHLMIANYALQAAFQPVPVHDLETLHRRAERSWELTHETRYDELAAILENLLPELESATRDVSVDMEVFRLLATTYQACAAALAKLRQFDAAWVAADRAMANADRAGDPLLMVEGSFRLTLIFQGARLFEEAEHTASTASAAIAGRAAEGDPAAMSLYGALQLQLAVIAARTERANDAYNYLNHARDMAVQLGGDRNDYNTEFGPTNVALHEVAVAVELGDAGEAIRRADGIDASAMSAERRGRLMIDVARAWTQRRNVEKALTALEAADAVSPGQVRHHRLVGSLIQDLLRMEASPSPRLEAFAQRVGVW